MSTTFFFPLHCFGSSNRVLRRVSLTSDFPFFFSCSESIDDSDDGEGGVMNGFIDDEASEDGSEGGDESSGDEE